MGPQDSLFPRPRAVESDDLAIAEVDSRSTGWDPNQYVSHVRKHRWSTIVGPMQCWSFQGEVRLWPQGSLDPPHLKARAVTVTLDISFGSYLALKFHATICPRSSVARSLCRIACASYAVLCLSADQWALQRKRRSKPLDLQRDIRHDAFSMKQAWQWRLFSSAHEL